MVNLQKVAIANVIFLFGFLATLISAYLADSLMPAVVTSFTGVGYTNTTLEGICWVGFFLVWILFALVMPSALFAMGTTEETKYKGWLGQIGERIVGVLWFFFSVLFFYLARDVFITALPGSIPSGDYIIMVIYWLELTVAFLANVLLLPYYTVIKGNEA